MRNGEFLNAVDNPEQDDYVIEGLVPRNQIVLVAGMPGEGKSSVAIAIETGPFGSYR